ncbi:MAG: 3-oxoacyl-ACP synthase III family protein [Cellulosilyticaceae bacterium]
MILRDIQLYYPKQLVKNDYYLERFEAQEGVLRTIFDRMQKEERYIGGEGETSVSMAQGAVRKVLETSGINPQEVGAVFFASQTPEYLVPTNAVFVHQAVGLSKECFCADVNANCGGMTVAFDMAYRFFKAHESCKYIIVVGAEHHSKHSSKECMQTYPILADIGCAVLLEGSKESFLESTYYTNSKQAQVIRFPKDGLSTIYEEESEKHMYWGLAGGTLEGAYGPAISRINALLTEHKVSKEEIGLLCCSQQMLHISEYLWKELELTSDHVCYVGDRYGYTGATSPFVSLYHAVHEQRVKDGEYIIFCSGGAGGTLNMIVYRYMEANVS